MQSTELRAVVASESPEARRLLTGVVQKEPGVVVVGWAENALEATSLARSLRPDIAVIDSQLPHIVGRDMVRMSHMGGLDAAMSVAQELPRARVILLRNLNVAIRQENGPDQAICLRTDNGAGNIPVKLRELNREAPQAKALVFAYLAVERLTSVRRKAIDMGEKAILYGGLTILAGFSLIVSVLLAPAGVVAALAGALLVVLGLAVRMTAAWWPKSSPADREFDALVSTVPSSWSRSSKPSPADREFDAMAVEVAKGGER
ncbi:MAG: hypothetical protein Q7R39_00815 [Dehalococcoidia bacterium]|nr:hypothetical protein [Dehalococcoidia bacterium]